MTTTGRKSGTIYVLSSGSPEMLGGVEHFVRELGRGLERQGFRVVFFHQGNAVPPWLPRPRSGWVRYACDALACYFIGRAARRQINPDVKACISNGPVGWSIGRTPATCKRIHMYHGTYWGQAEAIRHLIRRPGYWKLKHWDARVLERRSGQGKLCLANSDQTREEVRAIFGVDARTIWLPLDTEHFRPLDLQECRAALQLPTQGVFGLFVGSLEPTKNPSVLKEIIERTPKVEWLLAIRGGAPDALLNHPRVRIFADAGRDKMQQLYNAADILVCPSLYESFGYAVAEAAACGTPVVASPGGASRLFLDEPPFDKLLVKDSADIEGFCAAIQAVLAQRHEYRRLFRECVRPKVERWMSPANWWRRFLEVTGL